MAKKNPYAVTGPDGIEYPDLKSMCAAYGVKYMTYLDRRHKGMPVADALSSQRTDMTPCAGPDGKKYRSIKSMCEANGLNYGLVMNRVKAGHTLEEAADPDFREKKCQDHLGNWYPSLETMLEKYHVQISTFLYRRRQGWNLETALTAPATKGHGTPVTDFSGRKYPSMKDMCAFWHVPAYALNNRIHRDKSLSASDALLDVIQKTWPDTTAGNYKIMKCIQWPWFLCDCDGTTVILNADLLRNMKTKNDK